MVELAGLTNTELAALVSACHADDALGIAADFELSERLGADLLTSLDADSGTRTNGES